MHLKSADARSSVSDRGTASKGTAASQNAGSAKQTALFLLFASFIFLVLYRRFLFGSAVYLYSDIGSDSVASSYPILVMLSRLFQAGDFSFYTLSSGLGADNPDMSLTRFYAQTLDPLYGGAGMAVRWRQLYIKGRMLLLREKLETRGGSCQPLECLTDDPDFLAKALTWNDAERIAALEGYHKEARALSASLSGSSLT